MRDEQIGLTCILCPGLIGPQANLNLGSWTFLMMMQWLGVCLPMQGRSCIRSLVPEDSTCHGAINLMCLNYWACTLEPVLWSPDTLEPMFHNRRSHCNEYPAYCNEERLPLAMTRESMWTAMKTQYNQKKKKQKKTRVSYQGDYFIQGRDFLRIKLLLFSFIF